jgi:hypothetical protein
MITYPITHENKVLELNTINEILVNNRYRQHITQYKINISVPRTHRKQQKKIGPPSHKSAPKRE